MQNGERIQEGPMDFLRGGHFCLNLIGSESPPPPPPPHPPPPGQGGGPALHGGAGGAHPHHRPLY